MNDDRVLQRRDAGYSMIELLTVLVLIAVLVSLAAPAMGGYVARHKSRRALDRIAAEVAFARMVAVEQGRRTRLRIGSAGSVVLDTTDASGAYVPAKEVDLSADYPGLAIPTSPSPELEFDSRGIVRNLGADGYVHVTVADVRDSLMVSPAGRIFRAY